MALSHSLPFEKLSSIWAEVCAFSYIWPIDFLLGFPGSLAQMSLCASIWSDRICLYFCIAVISDDDCEPEETMQAEQA